MCDQHGSSAIAIPINVLENILQTGVFSATVAAFLIDSYKLLKPDFTDVSSRLLLQITQELADLSNGDRFHRPTLDDTFRPPRYAIHVNIFWFLSLCLSLACGLGATLVQQWLRRYIQLTQDTDAPLHRVRMRAFLFRGIREFHVGSVVENISVMLHTAIFLFFVGLCEFLFAINDEVAEVITVAVCILIAVYFTLTLLPAIYRHCPFQTPLTSVLWHIGHLFAISFLYLFSYSRKVRVKFYTMGGHFGKGMDKHFKDMISDRHELDKNVLELTLGMCHGEDEQEAFVDAIPSYLQTNPDVATHADGHHHLGTRFHNIRYLLESSGKGSLRHRLIHLFSSCTTDHRRLDDMTRRRRAVTCCRAVWEVSRASLSHNGNNVKGVVALNLPKPIREALKLLTSDSDSVIAASALRTAAIVERALLEQLSRTEPGSDPDRSKETVAPLAEAVGDMNDPLVLSYQSSQHSDERRSDERLNMVTDFTSNILLLIPQLRKPSHMDLEETRMTLDALCGDLSGREFPHADQQRLVDVLHDVLHAHAHLASENAASTRKGKRPAPNLSNVEHRQAYTVVPPSPSRQTSDGSVLFGHKILRKASGLNSGHQVLRTATTGWILVSRPVIKERRFTYLNYFVFHVNVNKVTPHWSCDNSIS
jgi:hypothetical protein